MKKLELTLFLAAAAILSSGCGTPTTNITNVKSQDRFNPAISATQRQHMMHRGPQAGG